MYVCVFCLFVCFFGFVCCCFFFVVFFFCLFVFCFVIYVCSGFISSLSLLLSFIRVSLIIGVSLACFTDEVEDSFYYDEALILNGFLRWLFFVLTFSIIIIFYSFCMVPQQSNFELQRQNPYRRTLASSEDSNQPARMRRLIRIFTGGILDNQGCKVSSCGQRRLRSDCADVSRYVFKWCGANFNMFHAFYYEEALLWTVLTTVIFNTNVMYIFLYGTLMKRKHFMSMQYINCEGIQLQPSQHST